MKTIIKNYQHPKVDKYLLQKINIQEIYLQNTKKYYYIGLQISILGYIGLLFIKNLLIFNLQNFQFISYFENFGIAINFFIQIIGGTITFVSHNIFLLASLGFLFFMLQLLQIKKY